ERRGLRRERLGRQLLHPLLELRDVGDDRPEPLEGALVSAPEDAGQQTGHAERSIVVAGAGEVKPRSEPVSVSGRTWSYGGRPPSRRRSSASSPGRRIAASHQPDAGMRHPDASNGPRLLQEGPSASAREMQAADNTVALERYQLLIRPATRLADYNRRMRY